MSNQCNVRTPVCVVVREWSFLKANRTPQCLHRKISCTMSLDLFFECTRKVDETFSDMNVLVWKFKSFYPWNLPTTIDRTPHIILLRKKELASCADAFDIPERSDAVRGPWIRTSQIALNSQLDRAQIGILSTATTAASAILHILENAHPCERTPLQLPPYGSNYAFVLFKGAPARWQELVR